MTLEKLLTYCTSQRRSNGTTDYYPKNGIVMFMEYADDDQHNITARVDGVTIEISDTDKLIINLVNCYPVEIALSYTTPLLIKVYQEVN